MEILYELMKIVATIVGNLTLYVGIIIYFIYDMLMYKHDIEKLLKSRKKFVVIMICLIIIQCLLVSGIFEGLIQSYLL